MNVLVSIIVPVYNSEQWLVETIDSIINQSHKDLEILLVDDGSTDSSYTNCMEYAKRDSRVRVLKRPENYPSGGNGARRYGFEQAQGKYAKWFDSDDVMLPDFISNQVEYIEQNPNIDVVFSRCEVRNADLKEVLRNNWRELHDFSSLKSAQKEYLQGKLAWQTGSGLWRTDRVTKIQPFTEDIKNSQEWLLHLKALIEGLNIATLSEVGFYVRTNPKGISRSRAKGYWIQKVKSRKLAIAFAKKRKQKDFVFPLWKETFRIGFKQKLLFNGQFYKTLIN
jgi:glycosyltransferase involved in cell wall biosynthesis